MDACGYSILLALAITIITQQEQSIDYLLQQDYYTCL